MSNKWWVYIVKCSDNTLYTGITNDLERRIDEHNNSDLGAKYTRGRRPVELVYSIDCKDKSEALKLEYNIKKMNRIQKMKMINK